MPAIGATRTTQAALLREVYVSRLQRQFNLRSILLQYLERMVEGDFAEGRLISIPLHSGMSGGWGWSDSGVLPSAGNQQIDRHTYNYRRLYGKMQIDGPHAEGARQKRAAEQAPFALESKGLVRQGRKHMNMDLFGDGTGALATPAAATSATSLSVSVDDTRGLYDNQIVDIVLSATGNVGGGAQGVKISVNRTTGVITITEGALIDFTDVNTNPTNYRIYRQGSRNQTLFGLKAIVSESNPPTGAGNYGGIDRADAAKAFWKAQRVNAAAASLTYDMIQQGVDLVDKNSDGVPNLMITSHRQWRKLANILQPLKRFDGTAIKLNGWMEALDFNGTPVVKDQHCQNDLFYILDTTMFHLYQNDEGKWMDEDGAILSRVPNRHAYEATWFTFRQLCCDAPNAQCVIDTLATA